MDKKVIFLFILFALAALAGPSTAQETVTSIAPASLSPAPGVWYESRVTESGAVEIVDLGGVGGALETDAPLGSGVVKLTTTGNVQDRAQIGIVDNFGAAADVLQGITISYDYFKQTQAVVGYDTFAAPSVRIVLTTVDNGVVIDGGTLTYEPYWNQPGGGAPPAPSDAWQSVAITEDTGEGDSGTLSNVDGGWWWSGGYNESNSFGGLPVRSLEEWAAVFAASDATDFANAQVSLISIGIGGWNEFQVNYFDNVQVAIPSAGIARSYNFEIPEPTTLALLGLGGLGLLMRRRVSG